MATSSNVTECNSVTYDNDGHDLCFSLTIRHFPYHVCEPGEYLDTPEMKCTQECGSTWIMAVYPYGHSEEVKDNISLGMAPVGRPAQAAVLTLACEVYILGKDGEKLKINRFNFTDKDFKFNDIIGDFITRRELFENRDLYLPGGHLTIRCEGREFHNKPRRTVEVEKISQMVVSHPSLNVLKKVYEEGICSDVVLKTGSAEFICHKNILSAASTYFKAMFGQEMKEKENKENVADLSKDLNEEELKAILDYIYLGKSEFANLSFASAQTLYRVSDMYEIDGFQRVCETELIGRLNKDNVNDAIVFATEYSANRLKKAAAAIVIQN